MVTKKKSTKKSGVKVGKLKLSKETVKDLSGKEAKEIKGGRNHISFSCGNQLCTTH